MIDGLRVTMNGADLAKLCLRQRDWRSIEADGYQEALNERSDLPPAIYERLVALQSRADQEALDLEFIAGHIDTAQTYLLALDDLRAIGAIGYQDCFQVAVNV